jgi:hypothetical protein
MDWTGTRIETTAGRAIMHLTASVARPYRQGDEGVVSFVTRYARATIERQRLAAVLVVGPEGEVLGEVLPAPQKVPF